MNPRTLQPFLDAFRLRMGRENEFRVTNLDIQAWHIGLYVRQAIASVFPGGGKYPAEPASISKIKAEQMTAKDHAQRFREFLLHYKRPSDKGGER